MNSVRPSIDSNRTVATNFDHSIDDDVVKFLAANPEYFAQHAAWNFNGSVWHDGTQFCEEVWVYGDPVEVLKAETIRELLESVNDEYGHE